MVEPEQSLSCVECGREQPAGERGWRAFLTIDEKVALYCPACGTREFGATATGRDAD